MMWYAFACVRRVSYINLEVCYFFFIHTMNQIKTCFQYTAQFTSTINLEVGAYNSVSCSEIDLIQRNGFHILWQYCGEAIFIQPGRTNNIAAGQEVSSVFYHFHKTPSVPGSWWNSQQNSFCLLCRSLL